MQTTQALIDLFIYLTTAVMYYVVVDLCDL